MGLRLEKSTPSINPKTKEISFKNWENNFTLGELEDGKRFTYNAIFSVKEAVLEISEKILPLSPGVSSPVRPRPPLLPPP